MNKDTFYFSHDYNARSDIKIKKIIAKHGYEGYGIFWALIEDLYQNGNAMPLDYDFIAHDMRIDSDIIESIINDFDLFEVDNDLFGSLSIQRRLDKRIVKSRKARQSAMKRWNDGESNASISEAIVVNNDANAFQSQCDDNSNALRPEINRNAIKERKGKESKGKDSKVKDNINTNTVSVFNFRKSMLDYGFNEELVDEWLAIRKKKKSINSKFSFNTFISQIEKSGAEKNEVLKIVAEKQWAGFNHEWLKTLNNNINTFENESDRRNRESAKRKQEIYEMAKRAGMVGGEENRDPGEIW